MNDRTITQIKAFEHKFNNIKNSSGTHSPSMATLQDEFEGFSLKVDACFLSNPYATDLVMKYIKKDLLQTNKLRESIEYYPSQQHVLSKFLAQHIGIDSKNIFIGNGATEIIQALLHQVVNKKMVLAIPTFSSYYEFAKEEIDIVYFPLKKEENYVLNVNKYLEFIKKEQPDTVVLINPNNPNGDYLAYEQMDILLSGLKEVKNVIIDESFIHFAFESEALNLVSSTELFKKFENVIIVKSLSKDFGIAGVRIGYSLMKESLVKSFLKDGYLWNLNGIAEYLIRLISNDTFIKEYELVRKQYVAECQNFFKALEKIDALHVYPSQANFALIQLPENITSSFFVSALLCDFGIYVRTANDKIGLSGECVRVSVRRKEENQIVLNAITSVMKRFKDVVSC